MPQPALEPGEMLITESPNVRVRETVFDGQLTNRRILLGQDIDPFLEATGKEFLLTSVKRFRPSADERGNPTIELVIALPESKEGRLLLHFDQTDSSRENERDRWVSELRRLVNPSVAAPAPPRVPTPPPTAPQPAHPYQQPVAPPAAPSPAAPAPTPMPPQQPWSVPPASPAPGAPATICPSCGNQLPPGARFCNRCGHQIPAPPFGQAPPQQPGYPPQAPPVQLPRPVTMADDPGYYQQQAPADSRNRRERAPREPRQKKEKAPREKKVKAPRPPKQGRAPREPRQKKEKAPRTPRKSKNADPYGYYDNNAGMDKKKIIIPVAIIAVIAIIGFVVLSGGLPAISLPAGGESTTTGTDTGSDTGTTSGGTNVVSASSTPVPGSIQIRVIHSGEWEGQYILNGVSQPESGMGALTMDLGMVSGSLTASFKPVEGGTIFVDILKDNAMIATGGAADANGYVTAVANV